MKKAPGQVAKAHLKYTRLKSLMLCSALVSLSHSSVARTNGDTWNGTGEAQSVAEGQGLDQGGKSGDLQELILAIPEKDLASRGRIADSPMLAPSQRQIAKLPPDHNTIVSSIGVGVVQGADFGYEFGAYGKYAGQVLNLNAFFTQGALGTRIVRGYMSLRDVDQNWGLEGGLIYDRVWGQVYGLSYHPVALSLDRVESQKTGLKDIGIITPALPGLAFRPVLAVSGELQLGKRSLAGLELQSDGSLFASCDFSNRSVSATVNYRHVRLQSLDGISGLINYNTRRLSAYASVSHEGALNNLSQWRNLGLIYSVGAGFGFGFEVNRTTNAGSSATGYAIIAELPSRNAGFRLRYQFGGYTYRPTLDPLDAVTRQRGSMALSANMRPSKGLSISMQSQLQWNDRDPAHHWSQVNASKYLGHGNSIQLTAGVPNLFDESQMRLRLLHKFSPALSANLEYGVLSANQPLVDTRLGRGFMLMIRSSSDIFTPPYGGRVAGTVIDQAGLPIKDAQLDLGEYRAFTNERGEFTLSNVPPGVYTLRLNPSSLPADYEVLEAEQKLVVKGRSKYNYSFVIAPLHSIMGRVWQDRHSKGSPSEGDGVANVVVRMGDDATITDSKGDFTFYNVAPGRHTITLDTSRLPQNLAADSSTKLDVELTPTKSISGLFFKVKFQDKPAQVEELP